MSEQADSSNNSARTVVYFYQHKPITTSDGTIKTQVTKFVNSDFFGSSYASRNEELEEMEKKLHLMEEALAERNSQHTHQLLRLLQLARARKLDYEDYEKHMALDIVTRYIIDKETNEVHKLKEEYEKLRDEVTGPLLPSPPTPPAPHTAS